MKIGELVIENMMLQKELIRLKAELERIKADLTESNPKEENKKAATW